MITMFDLEQMKQKCSEPINKETLVDIRIVQTDEDLPMIERVLSYIKQIKNPYLFLYDETVVRINHSDTKASFEERMKSYFEML